MYRMCPRLRTHPQAFHKGKSPSQEGNGWNYRIKQDA
jgi:hypothetical protein